MIHVGLNEAITNGATRFNDHIGHIRRHFVTELNALRQLLPVASREFIPFHFARIHRGAVGVFIHPFHQTGNVRVGRIHLALHKVHKARVHDLTVFLGTVRFGPHVKGANREAPLGTGAGPSAFPIAKKSAYVVLARLGRLRTDVHPYLEHLVGLVNVVKAPSDFHPALIGAHALSRQALPCQLTRQLHAILDILFGAARGRRGCRDHPMIGLGLFHRYFAAAAVVQTLLPFGLVVLIHRKGRDAHLIANGKQFHQGARGILGGVLFLKGLSARVIDVDRHDRIRRNVGLGLSIEEPSILLDNSLVKDVLFGVDVARVLEGRRELFAFQAPMTKHLLVF